MTKLVAVYDKKNNEHMVSHLNAHDLVTHCGYTYQKGRPHHPTDNAPFARPATDGRDAAQAILNRYGSGSTPGVVDPVDDTTEVFRAAEAAPQAATSIPAVEPGEQPVRQRRPRAAQVPVTETEDA